MTLNDYLRRRNLSPIVFAESIGVRYQSVYRYLAWERTPARDVMCRIAEVTDGAVQPNDFYDARPPQRAA